MRTQALQRITPGQLLGRRFQPLHVEIFSFGLKNMYPLHFRKILDWAGQNRFKVLISDRIEGIVSSTMVDVPPGWPKILLSLAQEWKAVGDLQTHGVRTHFCCDNVSQFHGKSLYIHADTLNWVLKKSGAIRARLDPSEHHAFDSFVDCRLPSRDYDNTNHVGLNAHVFSELLRDPDIANLGLALQDAMWTGRQQFENSIAANLPDDADMPPMRIGTFCMGGHHRGVAAAEMLRLGLSFVNIEARTFHMGSALGDTWQTKKCGPCDACVSSWELSPDMMDEIYRVMKPFTLLSAFL